MSLRTMRPRQPERPRAHPWLLSEHPLSREEAMAGPFAKRFLHAAAALLWCGDQGCAEAATATRIGWPMPFRRAAPPSATTGREMKRLSLRFNPAWVGWWSCSAWRVTSGGHRVIIFGFRPRDSKKRRWPCVSVWTMAAVGGYPTCRPVVMSLGPTFRRGHGSLYAALACGEVDAKAARELLVAHRPGDWPLVFAVDTSSWPRCDAECSPQRGLYYHPSQHSAGQPIVAG